MKYLNSFYVSPVQLKQNFEEKVTLPSSIRIESLYSMNPIESNLPTALTSQNDQEKDTQVTLVPFRETTSSVELALESSLRQRVAQVCNCYWKDLGEETRLPINPSNHGMMCGAQALQADFALHQQAIEAITGADNPNGLGADSFATSLAVTSSARQAPNIGRASPRRGGKGASPSAEAGGEELKRFSKRRTTAVQDNLCQESEKPPKHSRSAFFGTAKRQSHFSVHGGIVEEPLSSGEEEGSNEMAENGCAGKEKRGKKHGRKCVKHEMSPDGRKDKGEKPKKSSLLRAASKSSCRRSRAPPGPGAYHTENCVEKISTHSSATKAIFPKASRQPLFTSPRFNSTPGPGSYQTTAVSTIESKLRRVSSPSFGSSHSPRLLPFECIEVQRQKGGKSEKKITVVHATSPGPGAYALDIVAPEPPNGSSREKTDRPSAKHGSGFSFTKAQVAYGASVGADKKSQAEKSAIPGPSHYDVQTGLEVAAPGKGIRIGGTAERTGVEMEVVLGASGAQAKASLPGPGTYDVPNITSGRSVSLSFRHSSKKEETDAETVPGPGSYAVRGCFDGAADLRRAPGVVMGTGTVAARMDVAGEAARSSGSWLLSPGPGTYDVPSQPGASLRSFSFGSAPREVTEKPAVIPTATTVEVGPGTYDISAPSNVPASAYSFGKASRMVLDSTTGAETPGPGAYKVASSFEESRPAGDAARSTSWGRTARFHLNSLENKVAEAVPGPGAYDLHRASVETGNAAAKNIVFGSAPRDGQQDEPSDGVGPGAYDLRVKPAGPSYTIQGRYFDKEEVQGDDSTIPGPGAYDPSDLRFSSRIISLDSRAPRFDSAGTGEGGKEDLPGPGQYTLLAPNSRSGVRISTAPRFDWVRDGEEKEGVPGPGAYHVEPAVSHGISSTRGSLPCASRDVERLNESSEFPGPATYDPNPEVGMRPIAKNVVMGTSPLSGFPAGEEATVKVGPGSYDIAGDTSKGTQWTIPKANRDTGESGEVDALRGPGYYDPEMEVLLESAPTVVMGSSPRWGPSESKEAEAAGMPGPGSYDAPKTRRGLGLVQTVASPPFGVGEQRFRGVECEATPGPGTYDAMMSAREGADGDGKPSAAFGTAPRHSYLRDIADASVTPGPAAYDLRLTELDPSMPSISFPRASRENAAGGQVGSSTGTTVGPGSYYLPDPTPLPGAPIFGAAPREGHIEKVDDLPGPGQYHTELSGLERRSAQFGTAAREIHHIEGDRNAAPGPGAYILPSSFGWNGKGPTVPMAPREVSSAVTTPAQVGPGSYDLQSLSHLRQAPAYGFGTAPGIADHGNDGGNSYPGPGAYETSLISSVHPSFVFPQAQRFAEGSDVSGTPGPGQYSLSRPAEGRQVQIGSAPRSAVMLEASQETPGPGEYSLPRAEVVGRKPPGVPALTAEARPADRRWEEVPGPGAYLPLKENAGAGRSVVFTAAPRYGDDAAASGSAGPGPGSYDAARMNEAQQARGYSFPTAPRYVDEVKEVLPGPGHYDAAPRPMGETLGASSTGFASTAQRFAEGGGATDGPGPGAYYLGDFPLGEKTGPVSFPLAERFPVFADCTDVPGPGAYVSAVSPMGYEGRSAVLTGRGDYATNTQEEVPGPGSYWCGDGGIGTESPAYSIGTAQKLPETISHTPGPGAYYTLAPPGASQPAYGFSLAETASPLPSSAYTPGPGTYFMLDTNPLHGAAYPFGTAAREQVAAHAFSTAPEVGPGSYHHFPLAPLNAGPSFGTSFREGSLPSYYLNAANTSLPASAYRTNDLLIGSLGAVEGKPSPVQTSAATDTSARKTILDQLKEAGYPLR